MAKTRAIRIPDHEEKLIQEFLKKNPIFDFSSLARAALRKFIRDPGLEIKGIKIDRKGQSGERQIR